MKTIELDFVKLTFLDQRTVLVEAKYGVEITGDNCPNTHEIIGKEMSAEYGMIINRKQDYSIAPLQVYKVLNAIPRLKAIAIVNHKECPALSTETEQKLFNSPLQSFSNLEEAKHWLDEQLAIVAA